MKIWTFCVMDVEARRFGEPRSKNGGMKLPRARSIPRQSCVELVDERNEKEG